MLVADTRRSAAIQGALAVTLKTFERPSIITRRKVCTTTLSASLSLTKDPLGNDG
jgi:hypothetical protein